MKSLTFTCLALIITFSTNLTVDFGTENDGKDWEVISDGVMGGRSKGFVSLKANHIVFEGTVSLENNGGFSSFKSPFDSGWDLSGYQSVEIRYRAEGQAFAFTLETDKRWYVPYFKKQFTGKSSEWQTAKINLSEFDQYRIGTRTGNRLTYDDLSQVIRIGFTNDSKKASTFLLEVDYIRFSK